MGTDAMWRVYCAPWEDAPVRDGRHRSRDAEAHDQICFLFDQRPKDFNSMNQSTAFFGLNEADNSVDKSSNVLYSREQNNREPVQKTPSA